MDFPLQVFNRLTLEERDGVPTLTLTGRLLHASSAQKATYQSIIPNMEQGFSGTFARLERYPGVRSETGA